MACGSNFIETYECGVPSSVCWKKLVRRVALMTVRKDRRIRSSSSEATSSRAPSSSSRSPSVSSVPAALAAGRHAGLEERDEQSGGVDVVAERGLHVVLAEGRTRLPQVLRVGAQHHGLPPVESGAEDQGVEAVVLRLALPDRGERLLEAGAGVVGEIAAVAVGQRHPQPEVVDPGVGAVRAAQLVRPLVDDLDAELLERREDGGEETCSPVR